VHGRGRGVSTHQPRKKKPFGAFCVAEADKLLCPRWVLTGGGIFASKQNSRAVVTKFLSDGEEILVTSTHQPRN